MKDNIFIGTSGWSYPDWKEDFYPSDLKTTDWLSFYARSFHTTEVNSSFYHLPRPQTPLNWIEKVPKGFKFCPKLSRYITHIKRLKEPEESLQRFFDVFDPVREYLGPVLIQLPPSLKFDKGHIREFLEVLKKQYKMYHFAIEARHDSWLAKEAMNLLEQHKISWVISQSGVGYPYSELVTATNVYLRLHGPGKLYDSSYTNGVLRTFAKKINAWEKDGLTTWIFFNNTMNGHALRNAQTLGKMLLK